jgi:formylmethanofuran dehydrogenase subunit B
LKNIVLKTEETTSDICSRCARKFDPKNITLYYEYIEATRATVFCNECFQEFQKKSRYKMKKIKEAFIKWGDK